MTTLVRFAFQGLYWAIVVLFLLFGAYLVGVAGASALQGLVSADEAYTARFDVVLRSIGYLTIAVAALELGHPSACPTLQPSPRPRHCCWRRGECSCI
jgi:hypothetical protein